MTPPLTDTELLAYIERTTGLKVLILTMLPLGMPLVDRYGKMLWRVRSIAYEFYAHEQRVREEEREACAKLIEQRGELYVSKWMNVDDMEAQAKAYAWESRQHAIAIRSLTKQGGK